MSKKVLVTGGAGYIGSHTIVELSKSGYKPIILDDFRNSDESVLDGLRGIIGSDIELLKCDVSNTAFIQSYLRKEALCGIIHFAANKAVGESVEKPLLYYQNNVEGLVSILKAASEEQNIPFVFSSSCTVYGEPKGQKEVSEQTAKTIPTSPYGFTKWLGEQIIEDLFHSNNQLRLMSLRYFNPIGAHESALIGELPLGKPNNLLPFITQTAAGIHEKLKIFGADYPTVDGTCVRDYIHVVDLANAHVASLKKGLNSSESIKIYNVGTGKGASVVDVLTAFEEVSNQSLNYEFGPRREGDVPKIYSDNTLIKNELDWAAKFSLEDCLEHSWNWEKNLLKFKYKSEKKQD